MNTVYSYCDSPVGPLLLSGDGTALSGLHFSTGKKAIGADPAWRRVDGAFERVKQQLEEYFAGRRKQFEVELAPRGTEFQMSVWQALQKIPYGETVSYGDVAEHIGNPKAVRAVGTANGSNPIAIIVPCHRVIAKSGHLQGYFYGLDMKRALLELENPKSFARQGSLF